MSESGRIVTARWPGPLFRSEPTRCWRTACTVSGLANAANECAGWNGLPRRIRGRFRDQSLALRLHVAGAFSGTGRHRKCSVDRRSVHRLCRRQIPGSRRYRRGSRHLRGLALAAKSLTIQAHYLTQGSAKEALFERAAGLAQKAIKTDPKNPEAHIQSSRVMGRHAQTIGVVESAGKGYPEKIRDAIENALRLAPDMPAAHLGMGMWHAEVVAGAGSFMADILYGADEDDAIAYYEQALVRAPDEKVVPLEYALGLLALDGDDYREQARSLLQRAIELPTKDAFDNILHQRAVDRLAALDAFDT